MMPRLLAARLLPGTRPLLLLLVLVLSPGCRTARLPVPAALDDAPPLTVEGRRGRPEAPLRFGPYEAVDVDRSWTRGRGGQILSVARDDQWQAYRFTVRRDAAPRWEVVCETAARATTVRSVVDVEVGGSAELWCRLQALGAAPGTWELRLDARRDAPLRGTLAGGGVVFDVEGRSKPMAGLQLDGTLGYVVHDGDAPVAAVQTAGDGTVWLAPRLSDDGRGLLAASAAALLLHQDLRAVED